MGAVIVAEGITKCFRRYHDRPATLKETLVRGLRGAQAVERFCALDDVSFSVEQGRMLGLIGANGAGKSTLLRLLGGVGRPDRGRIQVRGRVGALLDLGAGFHPDLTGRENIFISGVITGLTRREVARRFDEIVDFAELAEFIDNPLRTYSTGMQLRLAFAVAAHIDPEVLLVDEVLAVGDLAFQRKCMDRIARFKSGGTTIVLVSHDISAIRQFCDEVIWLRHGKIAAHGPTDIVASEYVSEMTLETRRKTPRAVPVAYTAAGIPLRVNENRFGSMEIEIRSVLLLGPGGLPMAELDSGDPLAVQVEYQGDAPPEPPLIGITITREDGLVCFDTSSESMRVSELQRGNGVVRFKMDRLDLVGGQYYVDVGLYCRDWSYAYDYHWHVYPLTIRPTRGDKGVVRPPGQWEVE